MPLKSPFIESVRGFIRLKHLSLRTEETYLGWIRRYILFHDKRHPKDLGSAHVREFLTHLAVVGNVAASTQNQAFAALLFLYNQFLNQPLKNLENVVRAKRPERLPDVLTRDEVQKILNLMRGDQWLVASLLYGSGLRLLEALRLRVKDIDFARKQLTVRSGKGGKDRVTMLPAKLIAPLKTHLERVRLIHKDKSNIAC